MSYDQCLISKSNLFAKSWIAGTKNGALLKRQDIESVNVPATCEKLHLAITHQSNGKNGTKSHPELNIPFRIISNLCYGTLRIYQRQVNILLEMSRDLVTRSKCEIKIMSTPKRKSSTITTYGCRKKQRLTQATHTTTISNYAELLDDMENLQKITDKQIHAKKQTTAVVNLQIREITIREINEEVVETGENDNDEGFGNATNEELAEFINFFADENGLHSLNIKNTKKRKASIEHVSRDKVVLKTNDDSTIEVARCADITTDLLPQKNVYYAEMNWNSRMQESNCNDKIITNSAERDCQLNKSTKEIARSMSTFSSPIENSHNIQNVGNAAGKITTTTPKGRNKSKLIIDKFVRLNELEFSTQIENYKKMQYAPLADFKLNSHRRKLRTANELLNSFNRNNFDILKHVFKQKRKVNKENTAKQYLHILHAILENNIDDNLAEEIFPKWNLNGKSKCSNHKQSAANFISNMDELDDEINNNINKNNVIDGIPVDTEANQESPKLNDSIAEDTNNDWSPYGVMLKLLDIWRDPKSNEEINVKSFLLSSRNRINAALGFSSLLILAAHNFIIITKAVNSIDIQTIKLGSASMELISNVQKTSKNS